MQPIAGTGWFLAHVPHLPAPPRMSVAGAGIFPRVLIMILFLQLAMPQMLELNHFLELGLHAVLLQLSEN